MLTRKQHYSLSTWRLHVLHTKRNTCRLFQPWKRSTLFPSCVPRLNVFIGSEGPSPENYFLRIKPAATESVSKERWRGNCVKDCPVGNQIREWRYMRLQQADKNQCMQEIHFSAFCVIIKFQVSTNGIFKCARFLHCVIRLISDSLFVQISMVNTTHFCCQITIYLSENMHLSGTR